jgi:peptidoglycan/LPS O-acetylase OafA/YrhL
VTTSVRSARLTYWPALDGLRGLAVAAVLLFHSGYAWAGGGFLGVSLFFTLSGFLITSLVVAEHAESGRVRLSAFWARRARRLIPASILALGLALVVALTVVPLSQRIGAVGDIRAALFNVANWRFIWKRAPYADLRLLPSPVQHYWSLAIEEQFYLVFPLVAALSLRWGRRGLAVVLGLFAAVSLARQLTIDDVQRVYYGTDTRIAELAVGGLLALARPRIVAAAPFGQGRLADLLGVPALVATALLWWGTDLADEGLYRGGFVGIAVVSAALIFAAAEGRRLPRLVGVKPLVELGKISYGVYLFHFPLFLVLTEERLHVGAAPLLAVRVAATLLVALASYHVIERPIRTGQALRARLAPLALAGAVGVVLLGSVAVVHRTDGQQVAAGNGFGSGASTDVSVVPAVPVTPPPTSAPPTTAPSGDGGEGTGGDAGEVAAPATTTTVPVPPARAPRVVVVGDSTGAANGAALQQWGVSNGRLEVTTVSSSGCASLLGERFKVREGYEFVPHGCDVLFATAADTARQVHADAMVVFIGSSQLADWKYADLSGWHHLGEPTIDARYVPALDQAVATLEPVGIPILWADTPTPQWDLEVFGEQLGGGKIPGSGPVTLNDPARADLLNGMDRATLGHHPEAIVWPYADQLEGPDGTISKDVRPDGLHVSAEALGAIADRSLYAALEDAYRTVMARGDAGLAPAQDHMWSR